MISVADALSEATKRLRERESARADALLFLEYALGRPRAWIAAYGDAPLSSQALAAFQALCARRDDGVPAAYLVGSAGFYGQEFLVDENVLIPRPETEHLIDDALTFIGDRAVEVLDVGTGSGAIACTLAARTNARVDATDISAAALAVAKNNATRLGVAERCRFHHGDLAESLRSAQFDLVIANLPYVPTSDVPDRPASIAFEPRLALDGGADGLVCYRRLVADLPRLLKPHALVLFEAAPATIGGLRELMACALDGFTISQHRDYAGLERYVRAERPA